jgi:hypothetical protein
MQRFVSGHAVGAVSPSPRLDRLQTLTCLGFAGILLVGLAPMARGQGGIEDTSDLSLERLRQQVLERNENVHMRMLEVEISDKVYHAERGIFEPQVVGVRRAY